MSESGSATSTGSADGAETTGGAPDAAGVARTPDAAGRAGGDTSDLAARLSTVPTSTAKVILRELGVLRVVCQGLRPIIAPQGTLAGPARTVRFLPGREDVPRPPSGAVNRRLIDTLGRGEVVVIDAGGFAEGAVLGDMLAMRAKAREGAGVVADGVVRDVSGLAAVGLAVFARGTHPDPSGATLLAWETDVAVQCGGVLVQPGDWVLADGDAVVVVPAALAPEVATRGEATNREDEFCQRLLAAGFPLDEAYPLPAALRDDLARFTRDGYVPSWEEVRGRSS